jgi:hypothetical protein
MDGEHQDAAWCVRSSDDHWEGKGGSRGQLQSIWGIAFGASGCHQRPTVTLSVSS